MRRARGRGRTAPRMDNGGGTDVAADDSEADSPVEGLPPPPPPKLPELWLALVARFEAVGGLTADGIFRESADKGTLDKCEAQLFNPSSDVDADGAAAQDILAQLSDPYVRNLSSLYTSVQSSKLVAPRRAHVARTRVCTYAFNMRVGHATGACRVDLTLVAQPRAC